MADAGTVATFENRPNAALLVVGVQNGVVGGNDERDAVVPLSSAS